MEDSSQDPSSKPRKTSLTDTSSLESNRAKQVGDIDDQDVIDRLLIDDDLPPFTEPEAYQDFAEIQLSPGTSDALVEDLAEFADVDDNKHRVENIEEITTPELDALDQVAGIAEFSAEPAEVDFPAPGLTVHTPTASAKPLHSTPSSTTDNNGDLEQGAELAALASQIIALQNRQLHLTQELAEKANKAELARFQSDIDAIIQTQYNNGKRQSAPPTQRQTVKSAYFANSLAVLAIAVAAGLGYGLQQADQRITALNETTVQLQTLLSNPTSSEDNQEGKAALQKKLDDLTAADVVLTEQVADLNKALKNETVSTKTTLSLGKQLAGLSSQNKQTDAAVQALETKLAAIEKNRAPAAHGQLTTASPAKSEKKSAEPEKKTAEIEKKPTDNSEDNWSVSLVAFKQDWYAKRIADEYAGKGVPVKVSRTQAKGENWYRLSVDGFKNQTDANSYAAKVKKTLNLDSVLVLRASSTQN